jgi:predicted house-cleaning NTP pyrophosphatase (Maf/HAM1 superfamily)
MLVLASKSPRRIKLLRMFFPDLKVIAPNIDEVSTTSLPRKYVVEIAEKKAEAVINRLEKKARNVTVIAADTVVVLNIDERILSNTLLFSFYEYFHQ